MTRGGARWGGMSRRGEERREKGAENEEGGGGDGDKKRQWKLCACMCADYAFFFGLQTG